MAEEAIKSAKRLLAAAVPLQHPTPNAELSLATDCSLPLRRVHEIKCMYLDSRTHGLFIT
jgi:hypothetical protein